MTWIWIVSCMFSHVTSVIIFILISNFANITPKFKLSKMAGYMIVVANFACEDLVTFETWKILGIAWLLHTHWNLHGGSPCFFPWNHLQNGDPNVMLQIYRETVNRTAQWVCKEARNLYTTTEGSTLNTVRLCADIIYSFNILGIIWNK